MGYRPDINIDIQFLETKAAKYADNYFSSFCGFYFCAVQYNAYIHAQTWRVSSVLC